MGNESDKSGYQRLWLELTEGSDEELMLMDKIFDYLQGDMPPSERARFDALIASEPQLKAKVEEMQGLVSRFSAPQQAPAPPLAESIRPATWWESIRASLVSRRLVWATAGLAVVAAIALTAVYYQRPHPVVKNAPSPKPSLPDEPTPRIVQNQPEKKEPDLPQNLPKQLPRPPRNSPRQGPSNREAVVASVVRESNIELPEWAISLYRAYRQSPVVQVSRGGGVPKAFITAPNPGNVWLDSTRPEFHWTTESSVEPTIHLEQIGKASNMAPVELSSPQPNNLRATLPPGQNLKRGAWYRLTVKYPTDLDNGIEAHEKAYVFKVMTEKEKGYFQWAAKHRISAPLTSAMVFFRLNRFADAIEVVDAASGTASSPFLASNANKWQLIFRQKLIDRLENIGQSPEIF